MVHLLLSVLLLPLVWRLPETATVDPGARLSLQRPRVPAPVRSRFVGASIVGFAGFAVLGLLTAGSPRLVFQAVPEAGLLLGVSVVSALFVASIGAQIVLRRLPLTTAVNAGCVLLAVGAALLSVAISTDSLGAYVAISFPVIGDGLASQRWGFEPAGVAFSVGVGVLDVMALVALVLDQRRVRQA